jgi:hypothetical protein
MDVGGTVVLVGDVDGMPAGKEGLVMRVRGDMLLIGMPIGAPPGVCVSPILGSAAGTQNEAIEKEKGDRVMSQKEVEVTRLTSVQLLDAAIWREIGTEEPQPAPAFLEALSAVVGRWLIARSSEPEMDVVTVMCRARGYIERRGAEQSRGIAWRR